MQTWNNGERAGVVKKIIEQNFKTVSRHLSQNILSLSTQERELLGSEYLSNGLRCLDTTLNKWFIYNGNRWIEWAQDYSKEIDADEWADNTIVIPYSVHMRTNPIVQLFISDGTSYSLALGGVIVDENYNVTLSTDLPFDGKVVIK